MFTNLYAVEILISQKQFSVEEALRNAAMLAVFDKTINKSNRMRHDHWNSNRTNDTVINSKG